MSGYIVTCPACGAGNRVPAEREGQTGRCGSCHADLPPFYSKPQQLTGAAFNSFLASFRGPVLAEFWAPW